MSPVLTLALAAALSNPEPAQAALLATAIELCASVEAAQSGQAAAAAGPSVPWYDFELAAWRDQCAPSAPRVDYTLASPVFRDHL